MNIKLIYLIFIIPVLVVGLFISQAFTSKGEEDTAENLYQEYCASCHGVKGNGYGDYSYLLYPKPRDLTNGVFKIKSTSAGNPPTDQDLFTTIHDGMPGTAMPPFNFLQKHEIKSLVDVVKKFSSMNNTGVQKISLPDELPVTNELIELGKSIYMEVGCNMCHGNTGKGDGLSSKKLTDSQGYPIIPKDFTSGVYLGGGTNRDLYLRFVGGMDGTPMPSYGNLAEVLGNQKKKKINWPGLWFIM